MAQQVFTQWAPVAKAQNEQGQEVYLPFAGIHAQTRDGKDEIIVGAGNMVWTGSMWVPVSTQNRLPVDAAVSGTVDVSDRADRQLGKVALTGQVVEIAFGGPLEVTAGSSVDIVPWDYRLGIVQIRAGLVFSSAYAGNYRLVLRESALASSAGTFRTGDILQINNGIRGTGSIEVMTPRWSVSVVNQNEFDATIYRYSIMGVVG